MINSEQLIYDYLTQTGTALYALVGKRVWSTAPRTWKNDSKAILFEIMSEEYNNQRGVLVVSVQFECFGASTKCSDANAIYRVLNDILDLNGTARVSSGGIILAEQESGQVSLIENETEWPYARSAYQIKMVA